MIASQDSFESDLSIGCKVRLFDIHLFENLGAKQLQIIRNIVNVASKQKIRQ
jgi:hypothetical protein